MPLEMIFDLLASTSATRNRACALDLVAFALVTASPASARISPVSGAITGSADLQPARRAAMATSYYICICQRARISYLRGSKEIVEQLDGLKGHGLAGTQALEDFHGRFLRLSMVASILSSLPKNSRISSSVPSRVL